MKENNTTVLLRILSVNNVIPISTGVMLSFLLFPIIANEIVLDEHQKAHGIEDFDSPDPSNQSHQSSQVDEENSQSIKKLWNIWLRIRENSISHRDLSSSSSDSRDSRDEIDDYWRNPDYWDDYIRDDDYYKFIGDALPPTLLPLIRRDVIGFMLASLGATLGSLGGIGGGGLVVPIYIIATQLNPKQAIPLGAITVLGGSLAGLILNLRRRHPLADRPIIDWDLILVMEPLVLIGTVLGSILHRIIPSIYYQLCLLFS